MSERREGWYHVKEHHHENWTCQHWNGTDFSGVDDDCFAVIGPRIPSPDENWVCVPKEPTEAMQRALRIPDAAGHDYWAVERIKRIMAAAHFPDDAP